MSAICGIYSLTEEAIASEDFQVVMQQLAPYGKDGNGVWQAEIIALGHQMTHVTPESLSEKLPFRDANRNWTIAADARLDNRQELFSTLGLSSELQPQISDSQLILMAYDRWGLDCPQHLLGDFAVAIWDDRDRRLFCFRDTIGVKPFYYLVSQQRFIFASDIRAVLACPGVERQLDLTYVATYLQYQNFYHLERSFYKGLLKLPPASALTVCRGNIQKWAYWQPEKLPQIRFKQETEYIERLRELLQQAVNCRLRSHFAIGAHVSGGLDSSGVAVLAARSLRQRGQSLVGFSWSPPPQAEDYPLQDERALVEEICQQEQIPLHYTTLTTEDYIAHSRRDLTTEPTKTLLYELVTCPQAASQGLRVLLSGWGGDELVTFNGRGYFSELFLRGQWWKLLGEMRLRCQLQQTSLWGTFKSHVILPLIPDRLANRWRPDLFRQSEPLPNGLNPVFLEQLRQAGTLPTPLSRYERPGVRRYQLNLLQNGHLTARLESWAAHGAIYGIDYRFPLLDRRLMEFSLGIPSELFFKNGWKRYVYRCAIAGFLPQQVVWNKTKREPALFSADSLKARETEKSKIYEHLLELIRDRQSDLKVEGYLNVQYLIDRLGSTSSNVDRQKDLSQLLLFALCE
jgi:asparagine synthase (glutamine-hydrolysing)